LYKSIVELFNYQVPKIIDQLSMLKLQQLSMLKFLQINHNYKVIAVNTANGEKKDIRR